MDEQHSCTYDIYSWPTNLYETLIFCQIEKGIYVRARTTNIQFTYEFVWDSHFFGNLRKESTYSTYHTLEISLSSIFPLLPAGIKLLWLLVKMTIIKSPNYMLEVGCANFWYMPSFNGRGIKAGLLFLYIFLGFICGIYSVQSCGSKLRSIFFSIPG